MAEEQVRENTPKIIHPLWMPRGSVRAMLTLVILGSVWFLMFYQREIHHDLKDALLMVLGYYFAMRRGSLTGEEAPRKHLPLWLPGGTIRLIIVAGFAGISYILFREERLFNSEALSLLILAWGFFVGYFSKSIWLRWQEKLNESSIARFLGHTKAFVTIGITVAYCAAILLEKDGSLPEKSSEVFLGILGFYFGNR